MRVTARAEPTGLLLFDADNTIIVELTKEEARALGYDGAFPQNVLAPRFAHIEITSDCNMQCRGCYVERGRNDMTTPQIKDVLRELASIQTFQIAFGGGEPFLRRDVFELAQYATSLGLVVTVTTNGMFVRDAPQLSLFKQINVSYHGDLQVLERAIDIVQKHTGAGVNFVMSRTDIGALHNVASLCRETGAELLLLTYKPVDARWDEQMRPENVLEIARNLSLDGLRVAVDGFTCFKCLAAQHFVDIASSGDVYPCSFIRQPMGNVLVESFKTIWERRGAFVPLRCPYSSEGEKSEAAPYS